MEESRGDDMEYQHRLESSNERVNHHLVEGLETADTKRPIHKSSEMKQDLADRNPHGIGGSPSSTDDGNCWRPGCRRDEEEGGGPMTENAPRNSGLKRPQEGDADGEEHPPAPMARLEALCSLVRGDLGQQERTSKGRSETEGLISAVMIGSSSSKQNSPASHLTEVHSEWDVTWTLWWSNKVCEQVTTTADERPGH